VFLLVLVELAESPVPEEFGLLFSVLLDGDNLFGPLVLILAFIVLVPLTVSVLLVGTLNSPWLLLAVIKKKHPTTKASTNISNQYPGKQHTVGST
jgi:hypothetical protein